MHKSITAYLLVSILSLLPVCGNAFDPEVVLKTMDGQEVRLKDYLGQGKWTLVMIWASDCSICAHEVPEISKFHAQHRNNDARVIGVALDGFDKKPDIDNFIKRFPTSFPNLIADIGVDAINYQAATGEALRGTPTFLLYSPKGELRANNPGPMKISALESYMAKNSDK